LAVCSEAVPVYRLSDDTIAFPPPEGADASGLVAVGGDLSPERVLLAYESGIFPWPLVEAPLLWFSPDPRMVLRPRDLVVSRSLGKTLRRGVFEIRLDTAFERVIRRCAEIPRRGEAGTWITAAMAEAYGRLHELGFAHSAEAWQDGALVGGLYGVSLGAAFFGESMFADRPDASKAAFAVLVDQLRRWRFDLVDCQVHTDHLARFGAREWSRRRFLTALRRSLAVPTRRGVWKLDANAAAP
jgi:leucyl/phenylalanyl-tRNA--protein transferase